MFYYDARRVDPELIAAMGRSLDEYGPDRSGQHIAPGLAMVHRALHVAPEDPLEQQPLISSRGNVMTWDGRLDNRDELLLQLWRDLDEDTTDVALAMAVYENWGAEGFGKLIGDWSLVVFDAEKQAVTMASDYMGVRPLHYYAHGDSVSWSTTLRCLVDVHGLHNNLEPRFIVGYLSLAVPPGITPYKGLLSVPTAHSVTFTRQNGQQPPARFWNFMSNTVRYRNEQDYETHLRSLFVDAIRSRLRSSTPVWAQLSGGLDSSSIVCAADALIRQAAVVAPDLSTVCYITDGSPETDERRFMICVDQQRKRTSHYLQLDESLDFIDSERWWLTPGHPYGSTLQTYQLIGNSKGRVLLTGAAGDTVMGNCLDYHYDVASLLGRGRALAAVGLARRRALAAKRPIGGVLYDAFHEVFPSGLLARDVLSKLIIHVGGTPPATDANIADLFLLKPEFASWWREESIRQLRRTLAFPDISQRRPASELMRVSEARQVQSPSEEPRALLSHPYLHRPLVDFVLGIPIGVVAPPGQPRALMRRAFSPFVPHRIISRFSKGYGSPIFVRKFRDVLAQWLNGPDDLRIMQLDCVDGIRLFRYLESVRDGTCKSTHLFNRLYTLEQWFLCRENQFRRVPVYTNTEGR